jgi:hypothetical protein
MLERLTLARGVWPALAFAFVALSAPASAEPPSASPLFEEDAQDEAIADGDIDEEDRPGLRLGSHPGSSDIQGESWLSLLFSDQRVSGGKEDVSAGVVLALALDRIAEGPVHRVTEPVAPVPEATDGEAPDLPASLARECVAAAWRTSGLGEDDARIDAIVSRSRASALLPETRLRAMRLFTDAQHATLLATTDAANYYDAIGANLVLEARLTWRLDRLVYAGDESSLERVRLTRQDARSRLGTHTLEILFAWERALRDARDSTLGERERREAAFRAREAAATLDVLTGGWFSAHSKTP